MKFKEELPRQQFLETEGGLIVNAPAKINLSLLIAGKREDGFHEIETVMSKISWYDQVKIEKTDNPGIQLICEGPEWAPEDETNLVYKAAKLISNHIGKELSVCLTLTKNIPAGTGLGSASSDAASTFIGINKLFKLDLSTEILSNLASQIGSDIPFFFGPELAYCTGRGEKIEEIDEKFPFHALIITPNISVSTAEVYKNYRHNEQAYSRLSSLIAPNITKKNVEFVSQMCANMLQESCYELNEDLAQLKNSIESLGIERLCLSGSGCALYILFHNTDTALAKEYQQQLYNHLLCKSVLVYNNRW